MRQSLRRGMTATAIAAAAFAPLGLAQPALAQFQQEIRNDPAPCRGSGPAVRVNVSEIGSSSGMIRVQLYRGIESDWLEGGRWIYRIEVPARAGSMSFCLPVPRAGTYGVAVRHDVNGNGRTDITSDGGGMSNNPSINIFNLGKPSYRRTRFEVPSGVVNLDIRMRYM